MSYYTAAYALFWAALFGYLVALTRRQARLVERADRLIEQLARPPSSAGLAGDRAGSGEGGA